MSSANQLVDEEGAPNQKSAPSFPYIAMETRTSFGDYRIIRRLGVGGMSEVFLAVHPRIEQQVAIKALRPEAADRPQTRKRLIEEARILAALNHPGVIRVLGIEELPDGTLFLIMEYAEGPTLRQRLAAAPNGLPLAEAIQTAKQIAEAMAFVHGEGIFHRDLKPDNILLIQASEPLVQRQVKVLDFGIGKRVLATQRQTLGDQRIDTRLETDETTLLGTALYMAPEQCTSDAVSDRTDVYALGIVLYELLTGRPPFEAANEAGLLRMHLTQVPEPLESVRQDASSSLCSLVALMLQKEASARPAMVDVARELGKEGIDAHLSVLGRAVRRSRRVWRWLVLALLLLLSGLLLQRKLLHPPARNVVLIHPVHQAITEEEALTTLGPSGQRDAAVVRVAPLAQPLVESDRIDFQKAREAQDQIYQTEIAPLLAESQGKHVTYFGLAPVPLIMHLGYLVGDLPPITVYQRSHLTKLWAWPPQQSSVNPLTVQVLGMPQVASAAVGDVVLRIATALPINPADTRAVVTSPLAEVDILATPLGPDVLASPATVEQVARTFRQTLDTLSDRFPHLKTIHVFAAIPAGLAFRLGNLVSPTRHPRIQTYQFHRHAPVHYKPALLLQEESSAKIDVSHNSKGT